MKFSSQWKQSLKLTNQIKKDFQIKTIPMPDDDFKKLKELVRTDSMIFEHCCSNLNDDNGIDDNFWYDCGLDKGTIRFVNKKKYDFSDEMAYGCIELCAIPYVPFEKRTDNGVDDLEKMMGITCSGDFIRKFREGDTLKDVQGFSDDDIDKVRWDDIFDPDVKTYELNDSQTVEIINIIEKTRQMFSL